MKIKNVITAKNNKIMSFKTYTTEELEKMTQLCENIIGTAGENQYIKNQAERLIKQLKK